MRAAGYIFPHSVYLNDSCNKQLLSYKIFTDCFQYMNNVLCEVQTESLRGLRIM